ncbi:MAG: UbiA family prenyltransferase [Bacteriovorax sp.]
MKPYSIFSFSFWKCYWITARPYLMFLSGISGIAGVAFAKGNIFDVRGLLLFLAFFISYGVGQALTDVFQTDTDSISSPYRPLTQGLISKTQVFLVSLLGLSLCGVILVWGNIVNLWLAIASVLGLISYTYFKRRWWGGPFWNSWIVALLPVMGALAIDRSGQLLETLFKMAPLVLSIFFSYAIFVLLGYFKDISADRQTGYNTMLVVFGWEKSVLVSFLYFLATAISSTFFIKQYAFHLLPFILWSIGVLFLLYSHYLMMKTRDENQAHFSIAYVVRGYVWLHAGEITFIRNEGSWTLFSLAYLVLFEIVLRIRPEVKQI